jgi:hypothetical protein
VAIVSQPVVVDRDVTVGGIVVQPAGRLSFHPKRNVTLTATKNVVVMGKLTMRPSSSRIVHAMTFKGVNERRFVGGGMDVLPSDVGLWVMGRGALDIAGAPKLAWTRAHGSIPAGATTIRLRRDPYGWRVGDELAITPTLSPRVSDHFAAYDYATVRAISGRTITLSGPTRFAHPRVSVGRKTHFTAEVLNLSRNVRIEGTPGGRAHVLMHSSRPQAIRHAQVRYMGPRQRDGEYTRGVLGRYGIHFHDCMDGSMGSLVQGVVVRDCGHHAFVAHMSDGVKFHDCISHDTFDDPYWWDQRDSNRSFAPATNHTLYDRCVASLVQVDPPFRGYDMAGFNLGAWKGNVARRCVAVGVQGNVNSSGFTWGESSQGSWVFQNCVAHNNKVHGIFTWQNNQLRHDITRFVGYHNGGVGIAHGAYLNRFHYKDSILFGNAWGSISLHALSTRDPRLTFDNVLCDQDGLTPHCVMTETHVIPGEAPVLFTRCRFQGYRDSAFAFQSSGSGAPEWFEVDRCRFQRNEFWLDSTIRSASVIHVDDPTRGNILLHRFDQVGVPHPSWNATVVPAS